MFSYSLSIHSDTSYSFKRCVGLRTGRDFFFFPSFVCVCVFCFELFFRLCDCFVVGVLFLLVFNVFFQFCLFFFFFFFFFLGGGEIQKFYFRSHKI